MPTHQTIMNNYRNCRAACVVSTKTNTVVIVKKRVDQYVRLYTVLKMTYAL